MGPLKLDNSKIRNVELIQTYYSGQRVPVNKEPSKESSSFAKKNKVTISRLASAVILLAVITAGIIITSYFFNIKETNALKETGGLALFPAKYAGRNSNSAYYDYEQIKNNYAPIVLELENKSALINLGRIADLTSAVISFNAKGENGTEKVAIILRDEQRMSNANRDDIILTPALPKDGWQAFNVELKNLRLPLDKSKVTQIRLDSSGNLTDNGPVAKVYIKDIIIE
jgi:hypothetical protein